MDENDGDADVQYGFLGLDIGRIRYARHGQGARTLILLHGFGGDLDNWVLNIDAFGDIATVYAIDLPGHGQSVKAMPAPPVEGLARAVIEFMDRLGISAAHIAGHSLGGLLGMTMAHRAPERVQSLILVAAAGLGPELNTSFVEDFISASHRDEMQPVLELLFADPAQLNHAMMEETLVYKRVDGVSDALRALQADMVEDGRQRRILTGELASLSVPVLAIAGKADRIVPPRHTFALRKMARVSIIRNAGHMVTMEKYKTFNELLREHLLTHG